MSVSTQGVGRKMAKGAAWMVAFKLLDRAVGLISTLVLARLLLPADFGLIAMATSVIAIAELLQAFNFDIALIQNQDATSDDYNSAWTLNVLLAAACAIVLAFAAYPMAAFFGDLRVEAVIYCLALGMFVQGFENIGIIAFRKELMLHKEFWFLLAKKLIAFVVTVVAALLLRSYWALVIGMVSSRVIGVGLTYLIHPYRPAFSLARISGLIHFSKWLLFTNFLVTARSRAADIVVGRMLGAHALGIFSLSYEISNLPSTELTAPINRAVFPGYAALSKDASALKDSVIKVMSLVVLMSVPASIGIALVAEPMVMTLLGVKWIEAVPLIRILCFFGLANAFQSNLGYVFIATGHTKFITLWTGAMLLLQVPLVIVGAHYYGIVGAAMGALASVVIPMPVVLVSVSRLVGLAFTEWMTIMWRPVLSSAMMSISVLAWFSLSNFDLNAARDMLQLLLSSVALGAITYVISTLIFWIIAGRPPGPETYLLERLQDRIWFK